MTICHISSVLVDSVLVMPRTATVTLPYITALPRANSAPTVSESAPGLVDHQNAEEASQQGGPAGRARALLETDDRQQGGEQRR